MSTTAMDYFRRPILAGNNLQRTRFASIQGSTRRSDPDIDSEVPYFPTVFAGDTLNIKVQSTTYNVTLTDNTLNSIISDINTALGVAGFAFDADGSLGLQSKTQGFSSYIAVTGGTAADALGFDLVSQTAVSAKGGDLFTAPAARAGNWHGTVFPRKGENFTIDSVNRALGRIAGNMDVLFSDVHRSNARLKKLNPTAIAGGVSTWTPADPQSKTRCFTGYGVLSKTSSIEEIAPFFLLIDRNTRRPAQSKVVAVTRGVPGVTPPPFGGYNDTASWAAEDGGNALGLDLTKVASAAIGEVRQNRVVVCPGATFVTSNVVAGDVAEISGATNSNPWNHNGYRWVIEAVIDEETLSLRPMSTSELELMGFTLTDSHPVLELNSELGTGEVYGNLTVRTGTFTSHLTFVFDPPLPLNGQYDLYAAQAISHREESPYQAQAANDALYKELVSITNPTHKGVLSGLDVTIGGSTATVNAGYVRWNGKEFYVPARTFSMAEIGATAIRYFYWDPNDCLVKMIDKTAWSYISNNYGVFLGSVATSSGTFVDWQNGTRYIADAVRTITVGSGGQFADLAAAFNFINTEFDAYGETGDNTDATYPHFWDVVVVSDTYIPTMVVKAPGVRIRGGAVGVKLIGDTVRSLNFTGVGQFHVEDVGVSSDGVTSAPFVNIGGTAKVFLKNIHFKSTANTRWDQLVGTSGGTITDLLIENCTATLTKGVLWGELADARVFVLNSQFTKAGSHATPTLFAREDGSDLYDARRVFIEETEFKSWTTTSDTAPVLINWVGPTTSSYGELYVQGCRFDMGAFTSGSNARLIGASSTAFIRNNRMTATCPRFFDGTYGVKDQYVEGNEVLCSTPYNVSVPAIKAFFVRNNYVVSATASPGPGIVIEAEGEASGNYVSGVFRFGIKGVGSYSALVANNNVVSTTTGTVVGISGESPKGTVLGNYVSLGAGADTNSAAARVIANNVSVLSNNLNINSDCVGLYLYEVSYPTVTGNSILAATTSGYLLSYSGLTTGGPFIISSNVLRCTLGGTTKGLYFNTFNNASGLVKDNLVDCTDSELNTGSVAVVWDGNWFTGTVSKFTGRMRNCRVDGAFKTLGQFYYAQDNNQDCEIDGCTFGSTVFLESTTGGIVFKNNWVTQAAAAGKVTARCESAGGAGSIELRGNYIYGNLEMTNWGNVNATQSLSNNVVGGTVSTTMHVDGTTGKFQITGNKIYGQWDGPADIVTSNLFYGTVNLRYYRVNAIVDSNWFNYIFDGDASKFTNNVVVNTANVQAQTGITQSIVSGNEFLSSVQASNGYGTLRFIGNRCAGNTVITSTTTGVVGNNHFLSTVSIVGGSCSWTVTGNTGTNSFTVWPIFGGNLDMVGNFFASLSASQFTGSTRASFVSNTFSGNVTTGPCEFVGNKVGGTCSNVAYTSGSGPEFRASNSYFGGAYSQMADGTFSNCEFATTFNNGINLTYAGFFGCRFIGNADMYSETTSTVRIVGCIFNGLADIGAYSGGLSGGVQSLFISESYFSSTAMLGIATGAAFATGSVSNCRFVGTARFYASAVYSAWSVTGSYFQTSPYVHKGTFRFAACHFRQGLQCSLAVNNDARVQIANCSSYGTVQLSGTYRSSIVGCHIDTAVNEGSGAYGGSAVVLNGVDGCQISNNWLNTTGGTGCIYTNQGSTGRDCSWIHINHNFLQQNQADGNTTNCIRLWNCNTAIVQGNFAYKPQNGVVFPEWLNVNNTSQWVYIGGNIADSGNPNWYCLVNDSGFATKWFAESTGTHDGPTITFDTTLDGGISKGTTGIN